MKELLTPKQVARAIGVSESSLKRWCDRGLIPTVRTAGGHRRLPLSGVLGFLRGSEHQLVRPELLGLPAVSGTGERGLERGREQLCEGLVRGDAALCRRIVFDLFLADHRLAVICDRVITEAFRDIGEDWLCGDVAIYEERACEMTRRILHDLDAALPPPSPTSPTAIGGTISGDHYTLPTLMVELVLRDLGWNAHSLGTSLPLATLQTALEKTRPTLFWLSLSQVDDPATFLTDYAALYETAQSLGIAVVVGGRALTPTLREPMRYSAYCDTLQHLEAFIRTLTHMTGKRADDSPTA